MSLCRRCFWCALLWLTLLVWPAPSAAQQFQYESVEKPTFDPLDRTPAPTISVLTFGPGDAAFLRFGHNAIRVQDPVTRTDLVYNYGTFRFDHPYLILDFLTGKFEYWLSVSTFGAVLQHYRAANRSISEQVLNLGPISSRHLAAILRENSKPENRAYKYDYYRDNCSTRVRDVIDYVLNGALNERFQQPGAMTLRQHTLRATAQDWWLYLGLDVAMGSYIDQPETRWGEMFMPDKLAEGLGTVIFSGVHGTTTLVKETRHWHRPAHGGSLPSRPPERVWECLRIGIVGGGFFAFLGWEAYRRRQRWARALLAALLSLLGLVAGTLGWLFVGLWAWTDHEVAYANENILQLAPWAILLAGLGWGIYRAHVPSIQLAYRVIRWCLGAAIFGTLLKLFPAFEQSNQRIIALLLPIWCGAFYATYLMHIQALRPLLVPVHEPRPSRPQLDDDEPPPPPRPKPKKEEATDEKEEEEGDASPTGQPAPA